MSTFAVAQAIFLFYSSSWEIPGYMQEGTRDKQWANLNVYNFYCTVTAIIVTASLMSSGCFNRV